MDTEARHPGVPTAADRLDPAGWQHPVGPGWPGGCAPAALLQIWLSPCSLRAMQSWLSVRWATRALALQNQQPQALLAGSWYCKGLSRGSAPDCLMKVSFLGLQAQELQRKLLVFKLAPWPHHITSVKRLGFMHSLML